jgi:hypothetical protein
MAVGASMRRQHIVACGCYAVPQSGALYCINLQHSLTSLAQQRAL